SSVADCRYEASGWEIVVNDNSVRHSRYSTSNKRDRFDPPACRLVNQRHQAWAMRHLLNLKNESGQAACPVGSTQSLYLRHRKTKKRTPAPPFFARGFARCVDGMTHGPSGLPGHPWPAGPRSGIIGRKPSPPAERNVLKRRA